MFQVSFYIRRTACSTDMLNRERCNTKDNVYFGEREAIKLLKFEKLAASITNNKKLTCSLACTRLNIQPVLLSLPLSNFFVPTI